MSAGIDLHLHSNRSDGTMEPAELVALCAQAELHTIALSDHDTLDGVREAVKEGERQGVCVIPAIEMSAGNSPEIHILGYFPDVENVELCDWLDDLRSARMLRTARMAARLRELGIRVTLDDIQLEADRRAGLGRMHVARALVRNGYAQDIPDAFERFLKPGRPGFISRNNPSVDDVLTKLRGMGVLPVLAHGALLDAPMTWIADMIGHMAKKGLMGLECYHTGYDRTMERFMRAQAKAQGLLVTGGSDYHGANRRGVLPGDGLSNWSDAPMCLEALRIAKL